MIQNQVELLSGKPGKVHNVPMRSTATATDAAVTCGRSRGGAGPGSPTCSDRDHGPRLCSVEFLSEVFRAFVKSMGSCLIIGLLTPKVERAGPRRRHQRHRDPASARRPRQWQPAAGTTGTVTSRSPSPPSTGLSPPLTPHRHSPSVAAPPPPAAAAPSTVTAASGTARLSRTKPLRCHAAAARHHAAATRRHASRCRPPPLRRLPPVTVTP